MGNKRVSVILMQHKSCNAMNLDKCAFLWLENMLCTVSQKNTGTVYAITSGLWFLPWLIFKCLREKSSKPDQKKFKSQSLRNSTNCIWCGLILFGSSISWFIVQKQTVKTQSISILPSSL